MHHFVSSSPSSFVCRAHVAGQKRCVDQFRLPKYLVSDEVLSFFSGRPTRISSGKFSSSLIKSAWNLFFIFDESGRVKSEPVGSDCIAISAGSVIVRKPIQMHFRKTEKKPHRGILDTINGFAISVLSDSSNTLIWAFYALNFNTSNTLSFDVSKCYQFYCFRRF